MLTVRNLGHLLLLGVIALAAFVYFDSDGQGGDSYPRKPIRVVVPFSPGGGSDTFVRILQKAIKDDELMPHPIVIVNKPGGGTSIGSSYVKDARADGYTILCLHDAMMVAKSTGQSLNGPENFEAVAATGEFGEVILVSDNSNYDSLADIMEAAKEQPNTVKFGVSPNTPPQFSALLLERAVPGARFRFVATGGGASRLSGLMGGHLDVIILSVGEYVRFKENGLKAVAYLGEERMEAISDVPTVKESGYAVSSGNMHQWWFPKGTKPEIVDYFAAMLDAAMKSEYVLQRTSELQIDPRFIDGEPLRKRIGTKMEIFGAIQPKGHVDLPDFTFWTIVVAALFAIVVFWQTIRKRTAAIDQSETFRLRYDLAFATIAMAILYVAVMGLGVLSFVWATLVFVIAAGLVLSRCEKKMLIYVFESALVMSFGLHYAFTQIFSIDLP